MAAFMPSFQEGFEGITGEPVSDILATTFDTDKPALKVVDKDSVQHKTRKYRFHLVHTVINLLENMSDDGVIKANVLVPDLCVIHMSVKSKGLGDLLRLPLTKFT